MRYTHYQATFTDVTTDEVVTQPRPFTEAQLAAHNIYHENLEVGISEVSARKLVDSWNRMSQNSRYSL